MGIEKNEKGLYEAKVDEHTYEFEKWDAETAVVTLMKLSKIAGPTVSGFAAAVFSGKKKDDSDSPIDRDISPNMIQAACSALFTNLDEANALALIKKFSSENVLCDGKKIVFKTHYQDRLEHLTRVLGTALEVQYAGPFGVIKDLVGSLRAKGKALTQAQTPSPGSSTG